MQGYQEQFESLLNQVDIIESQAISMYLGGLYNEIGLPVKMFKPRSLTDTYSLARLQESIVAASKARYTPLLPTPRMPANNNHSHSRNSAYPVKTLPLALPALVYSHNGSSTSKNVPSYVQPRRQLTQKEFEEKRARNLCFYCDQRYTPGHKGSGQLHSLEILPKELSEGNELVNGNDGEVGAGEEGVEDPLISLNALSGVNAYQTMRIRGQVGKHMVHILVDSGSTHNFLDLQTAKKLGCQMKSICLLQVVVPGGYKLSSHYECPNFSWSIQRHEFHSNVMILPLGGCEMVLGIQWLATLGDVLWDFKNLKMAFSYQGHKLTLRGTGQAVIQWMKGKKVKKVTNNVSLSSMALCVYPVALMKMSTKESVKEENKQFQEELDALLQQFEDVFEEPTSLPPHREYDHQIILKDESLPTSVRPYRHPRNQKEAIEQMVKELLSTRVIRPSKSPFSSPIVMVKKKMVTGECVLIIGN